MLEDPGTEPAVLKQVKRELHRRKSMGVKVDANRPKPVSHAGERESTGGDEVRCWMTPHQYAFRGQLIGFVFKGGGSVRSLLVMYTLDPMKNLKAGFMEGTSIRRFKEFLVSVCGGPERSAAVEAGFGLAVLFEALDAVSPDDQIWEGNRAAAMALLARVRPAAAAPSAPHPAVGLVEPDEETRLEISRDSTGLRARDVFREWRPETAALRLLMEKMNMVLAGKIQTSRDSKLSAVSAIILKETDEYFAPPRRKTMAGSLLDNAYVAHQRKDGVLARQCAALAAVLEDPAVPASRIGFLVQCMRSGFALGDMDQDKAGPGPEGEGRIILPGAAPSGSARPEEPGEGIIVSPRSLIHKP
jgi:hypothetical protein